LSVPAYPVIYGLGIALGFAVLLWLAAREGIDARQLAHFVLVISVSTIVGGRLFYVLHNPDEFEGNWQEAFKLHHAGQVFYGGLLLGIPTTLIFCRLAKLPWRRVLDLAAVGAPAGLALGRWACFCKGCCYGKVTDVSWAIQFPKHIDVHGGTVGSLPFLRHLEQGLITEAATYSLPVHPAQIYSSLLSLGVFIIMLWLWKKRHARGKLLLLYLMLYAASRFFLEFFRDNQMAFASLTIAQVLSIVIGMTASFVLVILRSKTKRATA
jgi:phosphatidylglycerol:prolipoprotein diacylglycerol transferase